MVCVHLQDLLQLECVLCPALLLSPVYRPLRRLVALPACLNERSLCERPRVGKLIFGKDVPFTDPVNFPCAVALLVVDRNLRGDELAFKPLGQPTYVLGRLCRHVETQLQAV